ncbi:MAG: phosphopyruvate hydratase [Candidatus Diapherotrites archaeon]
MAKIKSVRAMQILDSRANPTVKCFVETADGISSAAVPSGASTGTFEALELRDGGKEYGGKSVRKAVSNIKKIIAPKVKGMDCLKQEEIDCFMVELDGTENKSKLGANAILAVSLAVARAGALSEGKELFEYLGKKFGNKKFSLPLPMLNIMNGGKHAGFEHDIQEHMISPMKPKSFGEGLRMGVETYMVLKAKLKKKFGATAIALGDEGGFAPPIESTEERLELMLESAQEAGYGNEIKFSIDCAASEFFENGKYLLGKKQFSAGELVDYYADLCKRFPIYSIEDGFAEEDWQAWQEFTKKAGSKLQIVGDDLLVTNPKRISKAVELNACNALLLKVNQIGSLTESFDAARLAFKNKWNVVISHRSGETCDSFIADLAVGIGAAQCKFGAPARSERAEKYNRLLEIESLLCRR